MYGLTRRDLLAASALGLLVGAPRLARAAEPEGQLTWAVHVSLAPTWFDPAETQALITPFMVLYALHDGMVKAMPKFVSFTPGVELVLEAFDGYWRKTPKVKRLIMKVIPDESTRLAALKGEEVDIAYSIRGELAAELERMPGLSIQSVVLQAPNWIYFPEQFDPKSPWNKLQVRQAANLAIDREGMSKALFLGRCETNNSIIPSSFKFFWQPPPAVFDVG